MNIALIGYGKMGKAIEEIALQRNHTISLKIDLNNIADFNSDNLSKCDVAIEFTSPHTAYNNVVQCLSNNVPTICGSTGWNEKIGEAEIICNQHQTALLVASNFSLGVNVFFAINTYLAKLMAPYNYAVSMEEIHHTAKKDAPSGTAISIAQQILAQNNTLKGWHLNDEQKSNSIPITAKRIDPAPGTHIVNYSSTIDDITITHTAHNRTGFALGAVLAAEFVAHKKGIFTMNDVLGL
jgi:4-hydroxy-tetrahydrodipicolinate reductase